jgi:hypothetical protein
MPGRLVRNVGEMNDTANGENVGHPRSVSRRRLAGLLSGVLVVAFVGLPGRSVAAPIHGAGRAPAAKLTEVRVPGTTAMGAAAVDLAKAGYTEREFYAEGKANRYRGAVAGSEQAAQLIDGNWAYRTRVLVRAPRARNFNGTLVVEWTNVTAGQDIDFAFAESYEYLLREGYAVAVVSAQRVGVERLKTWSPQRYGSLSVDASNVDPQGGGVVDACGMSPSPCPGDPLSWDIMTQVSTTLRDNAGRRKPLPGLEVRNVIALGESQSAGRLTTYYNTIQPLYHFFDGFVFLDRAGQLRPGQAAPAISVNSEVASTLVLPPGAPPTPRTTTSKYTRAWEVAGTSHASLYGAAYVDRMVLRDKSLVGPNGPWSFTQQIESQHCDRTPLFSTVDSGLVLNAAIDATREWITKGQKAAPTRLFNRDASGAVVRDSGGNVEGGVRIAQFTAPTAFVSGNGPAIFCQLSGHHRYFTDRELKQRYGSHRNYVTQVRTTMKRARREGYILRFDQEAADRAARNSNIAR